VSCTVVVHHHHWGFLQQLARQVSSDISRTHAPACLPGQMLQRRCAVQTMCDTCNHTSLCHVAASSRLPSGVRPAVRSAQGAVWCRLRSWTLALGEWIIKRLPLVKHIYSASKQVSGALNPDSAEGSKAFQECVLARHPRHGEFAIAFITGRTVLQVRVGEQHCNWRGVVAGCSAYDTTSGPTLKCDQLQRASHLHAVLLVRNPCLLFADG
jgi:hypothetical protein